MSNFKFSYFKKPLLGTALLKSAPLLMGKSDLGINHLSLEETPGEKAIICTPRGETEDALTSEFTSQWMPSDLIVAVDPFDAFSIEIVFSVREILAHENDQILLLAYSQKLTPSPDILTPMSKKRFQLDINTLEIQALYEIPAQRMLFQPSTRIGQTNPAPRSIVSFSVKLDILTLVDYLENRESIYLQAALLPRADFDAGNFERMILSEVDVISFVKTECPEDRQDFVESEVPTVVVETE